MHVEVCPYCGWRSEEHEFKGAAFNDYSRNHLEVTPACSEKWEADNAHLFPQPDPS